MIKKLILSLIAICCCGAFLVGCGSDDKTTPTATAKTPIQLLNESTAARFTSVWTALNAKATNTDLSALANRVGTLEGQTAPNLAPFTAKDTALETRIAGLESLNISDTFSDILAEIAFLKLQNPTGSPTPTPTSTVQCGVQKPSVVTPAYGAMTVPNGSVHFEWTNCLNAVTYQFWIGTDPSSMMNWKNVSAPARFLDYPVAANTYYYWKIVAVSPCGEKIADAWWFKTQ